MKLFFLNNQVLKTSLKKIYVIIIIFEIINTNILNIFLFILTIWMLKSSDIQELDLI